MYVAPDYSVVQATITWSCEASTDSLRQCGCAAGDLASRNAPSTLLKAPRTPEMHAGHRMR